MLKTLPFNALRTLESVVRLRGFGRAAEELNVTQSAVSQHIKQLEGWLGQRLLVRRSREAEPTEAGTRLAEAAREGFGAIEAICDELRGAARTRESGILVASPPGFAFLWLLPRLLRFDARHPHIPVSLSTDPRSRDPARGEADLYIAYSAGGFPGRHAEQLMRERMRPVCAPGLAGQLTDVDDLARFTILEDHMDGSDSGSNWHHWANENGLTLPAASRRRTYGQANLVVQAAEQGLGIAMGRCPLVGDALAQGKLVAPFENSALSQLSYWIVCEHSARKSPVVEAFRAWVLEEAQAFASGAKP